LDFLYGNGASKTAPDVLYDRTGSLFQARNAVSGDEWKEYAKNTDKVWYYAGSNKDDRITVDYVTEPGLLTGHHLITRATNNEGYFTFDAQVRLDFGARDSSGRLVWSAGRTLVGLAAIGREPMAFDAGADYSITSDLTFAVSLDGGEPLPVTVAATPAASRSGRTLGDLLGDINAALDAVPGLAGRVAARQHGDRLAFVRLATTASPDDALVISYANAAARRLGIAVPVSATDESGAHAAVVTAVGERGMESLLPPEGDFAAIIIDALDGNDEIRVGPTVVKSVWVDAGRGNDRVEYVSGRPILIDRGETTNATRNDSFGLPFALHTAAGEPNGIAGNRLFTGLTLDSPTDEEWYRFRLDPSQPPATLRLTSISPQDRITLSVVAVQADGTPAVVKVGDRDLAITQGAAADDSAGSFIEATGVLSLPLAGLTAGVDYLIRVKSDRVPTVYELEFAADPGSRGSLARPVVIADALAAADGSPTVGRIARLVGVPVTPAANNGSIFYKLTLPRQAFTDSDTPPRLSLEAFNNVAPVRFSLYTTRPTASSSPAATAITTASGAAVLSLASMPLPAGSGADDPVDIWLKVSSDADAQYVIQPLLPAQPGVTADRVIDLSQQKITSLASLVPITRRDVLLGGEGDDILQGGPGEDWIFGGPGDDVISGGFDRQAPDLMWGGPGNDTFQILTDRPMSTQAALARVGLAGQQTILSTTTDRFDGEEGIDTVFFMGGDVDALCREVPDNVALRWNTILHRYELTSRVWNTDKQEFERVATDVPAVLTVPQALPPEGQVGVTWETDPVTNTRRKKVNESEAVGLTIGYRDPESPARSPAWKTVSVFASAADTASFTSTRDLAAFFNRRLAEAGAGGSVGVRSVGGQLEVYTLDVGENAKVHVGLAGTGTTRGLQSLVRSLTMELPIVITTVDGASVPTGKLSEPVAFAIQAAGNSAPATIRLTIAETAGFDAPDGLDKLVKAVNDKLTVAGLGGLVTF
ncbi:MAG: hypothetical protein ACKOEM_04020, partial [Planctomycetia bacterium]